MSKRKNLVIAVIVLIVAIVAMQVASRAVLTAKECPVYAQDSPQNPRCDQQKYEEQEDTQDVVNKLSVALGAASVIALIYLLITQFQNSK